MYCWLDLAAVAVVPSWVESFHADCPGRREGVEEDGEEALADDRPLGILNKVYISASFK